MKVGSIDIGTNTVRFLVAELGVDSSLRRLHAGRAIVRLGRGVCGSGFIQEEIARRAISIIKRYIEEVQICGAERLIGFATSAVREAINGREFVEWLRGITGLEVRILTGKEEASWSMEGMRWVFKDLPGEWLGVDIGGGSTEIFLARKDELVMAVSIPIGMVRLTEQYLTSSPLNPSSHRMCAEACRSALEEAWEGFGLERDGLPMVGSGGTITTLAALKAQMREYDGDAIHGSRLTRTEVEKWVSLLAEMDIPSRARLPGMERGREDVILTGAIIVREVLRVCKAEELIVSDHGILEGACRMAPVLGQEIPAPSQVKII